MPSESRLFREAATLGRQRAVHTVGQLRSSRTTRGTYYTPEDQDAVDTLAFGGSAPQTEWSRQSMTLSCKLGENRNDVNEILSLREEIEKSLCPPLPPRELAPNGLLHGDQPQEAENAENHVRREDDNENTNHAEEENTPPNSDNRSNFSFFSFFFSSPHRSFF